MGIDSGYGTPKPKRMGKLGAGSKTTKTSMPTSTSAEKEKAAISAYLEWMRKHGKVIKKDKVIKKAIPGLNSPINTPQMKKLDTGILKRRVAPGSLGSKPMRGPVVGNGKRIAK